MIDRKNNIVYKQGREDGFKDAIDVIDKILNIVLHEVLEKVPELHPAKRETIARLIRSRLTDGIVYGDTDYHQRLHLEKLESLKIRGLYDEHDLDRIRKLYLGNSE